MSTRKRLTVLLVFVFFLTLLISINASAQEYRGSVGGQVLDQSGGVVAGARVSIIHVGTNTRLENTTDAEGNYRFRLLPPGDYRVEVEAQGFRRVRQDLITVNIGDALKLDFKLEVGSLDVTVSIAADAPVLESSNANAGQVIDQKRIQELPLSDGNPFTLAKLAPGVNNLGDLKFSRPFDNAGTSDVSVDGSATRSSEFTLDGTPNMANGRRVAFVPPAETVQEFKVQTAQFDAQQGHTSGAIINVTMKSGTNNLHGALYEFLRNDKLSANDFFLNRNHQPRTALRYNRFGGAVGGPIWLPKKVFGPLGYDGRDKTFWFFGYEGIRDVFPEPLTLTVPTLAERGGNFSALLGAALKASNGTPITNYDGSQAFAGQIYDPLTAKSVTRLNPLTGTVQTHVERLPFAGNIIPANRISPIALNILNYYPFANAPGDASGANNYVSPNPRTDVFNSESVHIDHNLSENQRLSGRYNRNWRRELRNVRFGDTGGTPATGNYLFRINNGGSFDDVYTISPTKILNVRLGFSRFTEQNAKPSTAAGFDPRTLGLSGAWIDQAGIKQFPTMTITGFETLGSDAGDLTNHMIYTLMPVFTWIRGNHTVRIGADIRMYRENAYSFGNSVGSLTFGNNFVKGPLDTSSAFFGQELSALMVGSVTGGTIDNNAGRSNQIMYYAGFAQDDWKVNSKLTLNLGLRYEVEGAITERYNRNLRGFDFATASPIQSAVQKALAANPIPEVPTIKVIGGPLFATPDNRGFYDTDRNNFQPRIGAAYQINEKTVLRGGFAIYMVPFIFDTQISLNAIQQPGFSQATNLIATNDNGLTFIANLANPYPKGILPAPGSSQGLLTFVGRGLTFASIERPNPLNYRWEASIQRELRGGWLLEGSYIGNHGQGLAVGRSRLTRAGNTDQGVNLDVIPRSYLSTSPIRDNTVINFLGKSVPNPFRGIAPSGTTLGDSATVSLATLLDSFPHFTSDVSEQFIGSNDYHALQVRVEKRFSRGFTFLSGYTWSRFRESTSRLNDTDTELEHRVSDADTPHRIVASGVWELPFGRGRKWGSGWNGFVNGVLGGWQAQGIWQFQSGRPLSWGNDFFQGDPTKGFDVSVSSERVDPGAFNTSPFYLPDSNSVTGNKPSTDARINLASNIRTFPSRIASVRGQGLNLFDLSAIKNVNITETVKLQIRTEFLNAFNHPVFADPNLDPTSTSFGKITAQNNLPRNIQIGLKLIF